MKKNNKGFTLLELLGVIVIIGIIATIAIGSYTQYISKAKNTAYETAEKSMKEAAEGMFVDCMNNASASTLCNLYSAPDPDQSRIIILNNLIDANYIKKIEDPEKSGEFCDALESYVMVYGEDPVEGGNNINLTYKSCLSCSRYKTSGCEFDLEENKEFGVRVEMRLDNESGSIYNSEWTSHDIWVQVTTGDPYQFGIKRLEYKTSEDGPWTVMSNTMVWSREGTTNLYIRAIDNANNISEIVQVVTKIDRVKPTAEFDIQGTVGTNDWYLSDITIGVKNATDGDGSGVFSASVDIDKVVGNTDGTKVTLTVVDNMGYINTYEKIIKIDKDLPTLTISPTSYRLFKGTSYDFLKDVTVTYSDAFSGIERVWVTIDGVEYTNANVLTDSKHYPVVYHVIDTAGNELTANFDLEIYYTVIKYRTRSWNDNCHTTTQIGVPPEGVQYYQNCWYTHTVCNYYGVWYPAGACPGPPPPGQGDIPIYTCTNRYCNGYYTNWSAWTTNPCNPSATCERATCSALSPAGQCSAY